MNGTHAEEVPVDMCGVNRHRKYWAERKCAVLTGDKFEVCVVNVNRLRLDVCLCGSDFFIVDFRHAILWLILESITKLVCLTLVLVTLEVIASVSAQQFMLMLKNVTDLVCTFTGDLKVFAVSRNLTVCYCISRTIF